MTGPRVSVVIPCHNAAPWIGDAVRSAVSQAGVALEVLVVDDGSTDESAALAEEAGAPTVRVVRQANGGASRARNVGTATVSGEFLQYLDADDVLTPGTLASRVARLESTGADVAYCDWVRWVRNSHGSFVEREVVSRTLSGLPDVDLVGSFWWPPAALLYRRALVDRIGPWREDLPIIQDARFLQDAAFVGGAFIDVPGVGAKYRVHGRDSLSRRDRSAFLDDCFRNGVEIEQMWVRDGVLSPERRQVLARVFAHVARGSATRHPARFEAALERVAALDPTFSVEGDAVVRGLSRLIGYRRAEYAAAWWQRGRAALGTAIRGRSTC
jgi:glycosyltransferase involved in cell wall biosynthesis